MTPFVAVLFVIAPFALGAFAGDRLVRHDPVARSRFRRIAGWTAAIYLVVSVVLAIACAAAAWPTRDLWICMSCPAFVSGPIVGLMQVAVADSIVRSRPARACRSCGYDLQGAVAGRCPECGDVQGDSR
ncbi:MAG: hypothetical protein U0575_01255 [Phycisphaerales bacterium]